MEQISTNCQNNHVQLQVCPFSFYFRPISGHRSKFEILAVHHTPTPTEKFLIWSHSQRISPLVPVTTTNHRTFDANGQRLRILLSDVSDQTTTNLMTVLLLTSTLTKCINTKNKRTLQCTFWNKRTSMYHKHTINAPQTHSFGT